MSLLDRLKTESAAKGLQPPAAPMPLRDKLKKASWDKKVSEQAAHDRALYNPTRGMSGLQKTLAGIGSGMTGVVQGVGNMVGLVEDETIAERKKLDQPLMDTGHGKVGKFIGETASLLPVALATGGSSLVGQAGGRLVQAAPKLAKAISPTLGRGAATAATEGALSGGILADPGKRTQGALVGAGTGLVLNKAAQSGGRLFKEGLVKVSPQAKALKETIKKKLGKDSFIPLTQAADPAADSTSVIATKLAQVGGQLPAAAAKMKGQSTDLTDDYYETLVRDVFRKAPSAEAGVKELREGSGNMLNVFDEALTAAPKPKSGIIKFTDQQQKIYDIIKQAGSSGRPDPEKISKALTKDLGSHASKYRTATEAGTAGQVLGQPLTFSDMFTRQAFHGLVKRGGPTSLGPSVGAFFGSKGVQNFIMGSASWQQRLRDATEDPTGQTIMALMSDIRRAMAAQAGQNSTETINQVQALRGE